METSIIASGINIWYSVYVQNGGVPFCGSRVEVRRIRKGGHAKVLRALQEIDLV
jgi:hypothetical protein